MLKFNLKSIIFVTGIAALTTIVGVLSCNKVDTTYTAQFSGSWRVDNDICSGFDIEKFDITTGSTDYSLNVSYRIGKNHGGTGYGTPDDTCQRIVTMKGVTNSTADKDYFSIASQTFIDRCGKNYTVQGSANIKRAVLPYERDTLYVNLVTTSDGYYTSCTQRGYK